MNESPRSMKEKYYKKQHDSSQENLYLSSSSCSLYVFSTETWNYYWVNLFKCLLKGESRIFIKGRVKDSY